MARRPTAVKSWRTVVSGGIRYAASGMSSKPTTLTSLGHASGRPRQRAEQAERHLVVGAEDGGDVAARGDLEPGLVAAARPTSRRSRAARAAARRRTSPAASRAAGRGPRSRPGGPARCTMSVWPEVDAGAGWPARRRRPGRRRRSSGSWPRRPRPRPPGTPRSSWARADLERLVGGGDQHDALDALVAQVVDRVDELLAGEALQVGRADEVAGLAAGRLDGAVHGARAPEAALGADHADGRRAPGDQRAGGAVGPVAELADRLLDPLAGRRAQVVLAVDDPRDGLVRDPGQAGDVGHHRRALGRRAPGRSSVTAAAGVSKRWTTTKTSTQHADGDPGPPGAQGAVEGDEGLDGAEHQDAEQRADDVARGRR